MLALNNILSTRRGVALKESNGRYRLAGISRLNERCDITVLRAGRLIVLLMQIIRLWCWGWRGERVGRSKNTYANKIDLRRINHGVSGNPFISYNTCRAAWFIAAAERCVERWLYQDSSVHSYGILRTTTAGRRARLQLRWADSEFSE